MREIKFRGKRVDNGEWVYGHYRQKETEYDDDMFEPRYFIYEEKSDYMISYEVFPETVGQFTGLKDKNGVDIYEGDIIKNNWNDYKGDDIGGIGVVKFGEHETSCDYYASSAYGYYVEGKRLYCPIVQILENDGIKIIGNKFENQELLGGVE